MNWAAKWLSRHRGVAVAVAIAVLLIAALALDRLFPVPLPAADSGYSRVVLARDGTPLRAFADDGGVWRYPTRPGRVSPYYLQALIGYEDRFFYWHPGVNPGSLLRAAYQWWDQGEVVSGGSTLTMQVARLLDPHERSIAGKLKQILRALQLEWHLSKGEILTLYLNHAPFGGTIEGVEAASYAYLGKSARELSHAEAALLAVLPQAPTTLRPDRHPSRAARARDKVLARLVEQGVWSETAVAAARAERVTRRFLAQPMRAPLFSRRVSERLAPGTARRTTITPELQHVLQSRMARFADRLPARGSAAILVVENATLAVRAYLGTAEFGNAARYGHVDMVRAVRSPGSTLKPFLYGFAIERGIVHAQSLLTDAPLSFGGYTPANFTGGFRGPVSVSEALRDSLNVPAVQVLEQLDPAVFYARLQRGGMRLQLPVSAEPNLAMILGGVGSSLEDLVTGYAALGRGGMTGRPRFFEDETLRERYMMAPGAAWIVREILREQPRPGLAGRQFRRGVKSRIAWKTGTSYGYRDAWAVGVNADYTVGVWVGRPDGTPVPGHYGAVTAAPILFNVFDTLLGGASWTVAEDRPESVVKADVCWPLGRRADAQPANHCHRRREAWLYRGLAPPTLPDRQMAHWRGRVKRYWVDPGSGERLLAGCGSAERAVRSVARWPVALTPWLAGDVRRRQRLPPLSRQCRGAAAAGDGGLRIAGVTDGAVLRPAGASTKPPRVTFSTLGAEDHVYWLINGRVVQRTAPTQPFVHRFDEAGGYRVSAVDAAGRSDSVAVDVIAPRP